MFLDFLFVGFFYKIFSGSRQQFGHEFLLISCILCGTGKVIEASCFDEDAVQRIDFRLALIFKHLLPQLHQIIQRFAHITHSFVTFLEITVPVGQYTVIHVCGPGAEKIMHQPAHGIIATVFPVYVDDVGTVIYGLACFHKAAFNVVQGKLQPELVLFGDENHIGFSQLLAILANIGLIGIQVTAVAAHPLDACSLLRTLYFYVYYFAIKRGYDVKPYFLPLEAGDGVFDAAGYDLKIRLVQNNLQH